MLKTILAAVATAVLVASGFVMGVAGQSKNTASVTDTVGSVQYDRAEFAGDVYQGGGALRTLMMRDGLIVGPYKETYETITAADTLTVQQSGTTVYFASSTASTSTLPAVASSAGVVFRFAVADLFTGDKKIASVEGDNIYGTLIVNGAAVPCDATDIVSFVGDGEALGDFVDVRSNGSKWLIGASGASTTAKLTCSG